MLNPFQVKRRQTGTMINNKNILLFDGFCNLCSRLVNFIIKRDKKAKFLFVSLQSASGQSLLKKFGLPTDDFDSVVYIRSDKYFLKSSAILHILKELGGIWKLFFIFIIIPNFIRDFIYKIIAKTRYKIFGRHDSCIY
jgi:predicted DCC family thiol-disulfide oxidoreductase YuxK